MDFIVPYKLTDLHKLDSLVEHRSKFSLDFCELNVFETRQKASDFQLQFNSFTITSMLRGKKIMHLEGFDDFEYVPGETVIAPSETLMRIDFPEAEIAQPTQCTALVIENQYLDQQLEFINSTWKGPRFSNAEWYLNPTEAILQNNRDLARISTRLLEVFPSNDPFKEYQVDLILRELVLTMLKLQNLTGLRKEYITHTNRSPFHAVLSYIASHLSADIRIEELCRVACMSKSSFYRAFTEEYGITPVQFILEERLKYAKLLLDNPEVSVKEAAYASGFNDPNYFSRMFRKMQGISPSEYRVGIA